MTVDHTKQEPQQQQVTATTSLGDESSSTSSGSSSAAETREFQNDNKDLSDPASQPSSPSSPLSSSSSSSSSTVTSSSSSVLTWIVSIVRLIIVDIPLLALFLTWLSTIILIQLHDSYFAKQLHLMKFISANRDYTDTTYYHRNCDEDDITTTNVQDLLIPPSYTTKQCADHMLLHGASLYPNLITVETASQLREFIDRENKLQEGWFVINNENRYSWGIDINMHAALHTFWKELASNVQLVEALESIVGPDPAVIEFTAITSSYGALDQFDHSDVVSPGSAAKFGRSFVPSYSLFIPLQNVTYDMGATHVCPGTHLCSDGGPKVCPRNHNNIALSGGKGLSDPNRNDGVWQVGSGALLNQQTTHKGMGYTMKGGPDRVVIIATFAPRPQFKSGVETRMIGQGGSYSILWTQNGHTFSDFVNAHQRMTEPQKTLRSLGIIKGNGWNWPTVSSMRISNEDNGFDQGPLDEFIESGGFKFLPPSWQELDYTDFARTHKLQNWHAFVLGTLIKTSSNLQSINAFMIGLYLCILALVDIVWKLLNRKTDRRRLWSFTMRGIVRLVITHGSALVLGWVILHYVSTTNWARQIRAGRAYQLPYPKSVDEDNLVRSTIPYKTDILMVPHYASNYLASYARVVNENHNGNRYWKTITRNFGPSYSTFPHNLQRAMCTSLIQSIQSDRRFLNQDPERFWGTVHDEDELWKFCHREMYMESSLRLRRMLTTIDELRVEAQYGKLRDTHISNTTIPAVLDDLENIVLSPPSTASHHNLSMSTVSTDDDAKIFLPSPTWSLPPLPQISKTMSYERRLSLPPIYAPMEPFPGAWLEEGDIVEVKYKCRYNEWYRAEILVAIPNTATFHIMYTDGEDEFDVRRRCVRRFKEFVVGERVEARSENDPQFLQGRVVRLHPNSIYDVELEGGTLLQSVLSYNIRRFDYDPSTSSIQAGSRVMAEYDGSGEYYPGTVVRVNNDQTVFVEYDDGDVDQHLDIRNVKIM